MRNMANISIAGIAPDRTAEQVRPHRLEPHYGRERTDTKHTWGQMGA